MTNPTTTPTRCPNCFDRRYISGRTRLPNGTQSTRFPCYLCNPNNTNPPTN
jgi:hypothetical protein